MFKVSHLQHLIMNYPHRQSPCNNESRRMAAIRLHCSVDKLLAIIELKTPNALMQQIGHTYFLRQHLYFAPERDVCLLLLLLLFSGRYASFKAQLSEKRTIICNKCNSIPYKD